MFHVTPTHSEIRREQTVEISEPQVRPFLGTVRQISKRNRAFTEASIRNLIFKAEPRQSSRGEIPGNGLLEAGAIIRIGRKVLIDEGKFLAWVQAQGGNRKVKV